MNEPTIQVTLTLPAAILTAFHAAQREREVAHMQWQTLKEYLVDQLLASLLREHQRRVLAPARTLARHAPAEDQREMGSRLAFLRRIAPDEGGGMSHFD